MLQKRKKNCNDFQHSATLAQLGFELFALKWKLSWKYFTPRKCEKLELT